MITPEHLGDGAYVAFNGNELVLTANGVGREATDTVVLDQNAFEALTRFVEKVKAHQAKGGVA